MYLRQTEPTTVKLNDLQLHLKMELQTIFSKFHKPNDLFYKLQNTLNLSTVMIYN